jgi:hypothetical protein
MRAPRAVLVVAALLLAGPAVTVAQAAATASPAARHALPAHAHKRVCSFAPSGAAACNAHIVTSSANATPLATTSYSFGYRPVDLQTAYGIGAGVGAPTVAIVDAYDNPNVEADLGVYRSQFGLPACTTANGCFKKVNQSGGTSYPTKNVGWGQEIALDVEMASAMCPNCKVLLVEASSNSFGNLMAAVDYATAHAGFVSNSYGGSEFNGETSYDGHFNKPGVVITVSSGDNGYGAEYPAASQYVTAVGGTTLNLDASGNRSSETAWSGAGSGCSAYEPKPSWQHDSGCARRTVADVSAVADPSTGVAVYDSYGSSGGANWLVFGGTSVAAPVVAGVYAVAGTPGASDRPSSYPYNAAAAGSLFDITSGNNGSCGTYLCKGLVGYDGPTGLGAPNGTTAFAAPGSSPPPPPPDNQPPVIDNTSQSCAANKCTFTVTAHDPEGKTLTYAWSRGTSTTSSSTLKFAKAGSFTVTVTVSDGVNPVPASFSVSCTMTARVTCS